VDSDPFSLSGRVAVITGASRNIGAAIAFAFAQSGADLLLVARGGEPLASVGKAIRERTGRSIETFAVDVGEPDAAERISEYARQRLPTVNVLVNNAYAVGAVETVFDTDDQAWRDALVTNIMAPMRLCRVFGTDMLRHDGGSIINVLSGSGFLPSPRLSAYGASKAALWMLTRYLAVEGAPTVRANGLCPGLISESGKPRSESQQRLLPQVPMKRVGLPSEVTGAAVYLASNASSYTTGEVIFVNGGRPW
jgi:NAD(P)-dependent dehydrogenase (short-subunit alcohol dehydrogenase family)